MNLFGEETTPEKEEPSIELNDLSSEVVAPSKGLCHPREMSFCIGHDDIEKRLLEMFESGRMPHGLIFTGQKGIGKATMAFRLARFLLQDHADPNQDSMFADETATVESLYISPDNTVFSRVASGGHADFKSIEREYDATKNRYKDSVPVDAIRKVPGFLRMTSSNGGWRVVIIDDADTMNRNAQNALLKVLEEPPKKTILILVTHRLGALIPTIRSRAQVINFQPLNESNLQQLIDMQDYALTPDQTKMLIHLSEGSIGQATDFMEEGALETLDQILELLQYHPFWDWEKLHAISDNLARPGQDLSYNTFTSLLSWFFVQLCVAKARGNSMETLGLGQGTLQNLLNNSSLEQLLKICENLHAHFDRVQRANLDKRQGVLGAFSLITAQ